MSYLLQISREDAETLKETKNRLISIRVRWETKHFVRDEHYLRNGNAFQILSN